MPSREPPERFPVTFYVVAMLFVMFDIELIFIYPYAVDRPFLGTYGFVEMLAFSVVFFGAFVYVVANIAVTFYYLRERRSEFNVLLHLVFPVVSTLVLLFAILVSFQPVCQNYGTCPVEPYSYAPLVDGLWLLIGVGVLLYYYSRKREDWVRNAGAALGESEAELAKATS